FLAIYDETLFSKKTEYLSYHEMRDIKTQENDLDSFKFVFLELSKFTNEIENLKTLTEKWAYFFKHATETSEEDLAKIVGGDLIIERAYKELDRFGWSKEELMEYEAVDMKIESVRDSMEGSFSDGENNKAREIVLNMHRMGMDIDTISKATSLTCEAVKNIIKEKEEENPEDE
ncbi:MAG: hypothetical protein B7Y25_04520, partial [Alphaproteobacteria bacterium 16-39-46]